MGGQNRESLIVGVWLQLNKSNKCSQGKGKVEMKK